jgi:hypothetical protein
MITMKVMTMSEEVRRRAVVNQGLLRMGDLFPEVGPILRNPRRRTDFMKLISGIGAAMQPPHTCPEPERIEVRVPVEVPVRVDLTMDEMARLLRRSGWIVKVPATEGDGGRRELGALSPGSQSHRLLRAFYDNPDGLTDEGARIEAKLPVRAVYWKRTSELRERGYLSWAVDPLSGEYEMRPSPSTGVMVHVSVITEEGAQALKELENA